MYHTTAWRLALGLFAGLLALPAAAADRYVFDKAHTQILFFVDHLGFSRSQGEFLDYDGEFRFDPADWSAGSVQLTIRTHSIDMDDYEWNQHLRGQDFFRVNEYPEMSFKSLSVESSGENQGRIHGELTLLGVTRPVTLEVRFNKAGVHPFNKQYVAGFSASTRIKRSEFGMNYGLPMVGDEVEVMLEVEGFRQSE